MARKRGGAPASRSGLGTRMSLRARNLKIAVFLAVGQLLCCGVLPTHCRPQIVLPILNIETRSGRRRSDGWRRSRSGQHVNQGGPQRGIGSGDCGVVGDRRGGSEAGRVHRRPCEVVQGKSERNQSGREVDGPKNSSQEGDQQFERESSGTEEGKTSQAQAQAGTKDARLNSPLTPNCRVPHSFAPLE